MTWDVLRYDTVDSTNNVCKALAAQGLDSTAVIARAQTAGKGRLGRSFQSPEGGLYLSALWQDCPAGQSCHRAERYRPPSGDWNERPSRPLPAVCARAMTAVLSSPCAARALHTLLVESTVS